jgi:ribonuclease T2
VSLFVLALFIALGQNAGRRVRKDRWGLVMVALSVRAVFASALAVVTIAPAFAQDSPQNAAEFDFYVLSLSWSPSFCAASTERNDGRSASLQCGTRPYSFVVHGLWPQYDKGFPEYCQVPAPRLNRGIMSSMLDLMPAPGLIFSEWDKHGTCSGLSPRAYFDTVRKARAVIKIPPEYTELAEALTVTPAAVEDAFAKANAGLPADGIAVECDKKRLTEVRVCLSKDLQFRGCPEIARRSCRREQVLMPPLR